VERSLCTPAKRNSLLAWPGFSQKADNPELWPKNLSGGDLFLGAKAISVFWRTINLIKIVYQPENPLEAKAYLAFGHRWFDTNALIGGKQQKTEDSNTIHSFTSKETESEVSPYLEQVRHYYDQMNPMILKYVGKTYQSGLLTTNLKANPYRETNLYCAVQAGIQPGYHILDAGCGVCGPSIDIAQHIEEIRIDAITLSPAQANTAKELVQQAGLTDRIQVHVGDFHQLPFADEVFDLVFFLESSGYSYDRRRLFAEVYRVLRPGGSLYIKEPFRKESSLSDQEQHELAELNRIYVYKIARMSEFVTSISAVGFQNIISRDLSEILSMEEINKTMFEYHKGFPILTEFGKVHYRNFKCLPTFFGEIKAYKPS
jgi:ubiquinone/menaquinone biosynthesis C-methylase UbiE